MLIGRRLLSLPDDLTYIQEEDEDFELTTELLQKSLMVSSTTSGKRWSKEYLLELRESHRYLTTPKNKPPITEGDIVQPRGFWRLARGFWRLAHVQKLLVSKDGQVRGAEVRASTPTGQISILRRPV